MLSHIVGDRGVDVVERPDLSLGGRPGAAADRRGTLGRLAPAALELVERRVELAPLASREEAPLEGVLEPVVVLAVAAAGQLGAGALDARAGRGPHAAQARSSARSRIRASSSLPVALGRSARSSRKARGG